MDTTEQTIDPEIQKLIDDFTEQIAKKDPEIASSQRSIDFILSGAETELEKIEAELEVRFEANKVSEEEYLNALRTEKEKILLNTQEKLDALVAKYEKIHKDLDM